MANARTVVCPVCGTRRQAGGGAPFVTCLSCGTRIPLRQMSPMASAPRPRVQIRAAAAAPAQQQAPATGAPRRKGCGGTVFLALSIAAAVAAVFYILVSNIIAKSGEASAPAVRETAAAPLPEGLSRTEDVRRPAAGADAAEEARKPEPAETVTPAKTVAQADPPPEPRDADGPEAEDVPALETREVADASDEPAGNYDIPPSPQDEETVAEEDMAPEGTDALIESSAPERDKPSFLRPVPWARLVRMDPAATPCGKAREAFRRGPHGVSFAKADSRKILAKALAAVPRLLPAVKRQSDAGDQAELDRAWIIQSAGHGAIERIASEEGGVEFLDDFFNDPAWMEDFAGSGPAKHGWAAALGTLSLLHWNDVSRWALSTVEGRRVATAIALNCKPSAEEDNVSRFLAYERLARGGRLHAKAYENSCREWREVVNGGFAAREIEFMNHYKNDRYDTYAGVFQHVPYRMRNCFGEHIHHGHYYEPWLWLRQWAEVAVPVGGVCGALSTYGSRCAVAHGLPSITCGQPDHCAFALRNRDGSWRIGNYIERWTRPHWTILGQGYHAIEACEFMYERPEDTAISERNRRLAETLRRMQGASARAGDAAGGKPRKRSPAIEAAYEAAVAAAPGNILAWRSRIGWMESEGATPAEWEALADKAAKSLAPSPWSAWEIAGACMEHAGKTDRKRTLAILGRLHRALREPQRSVAEPYDYGAVLARHEKLLGGGLAAKAELFDAVAAAQAGTRTFFDFATKWAGTVFMSSPETSSRFLKTIGRLADPATYSGRYLADRELAQKAGGKAPKIDFDAIILAAAEARNFKGFSEALQICRKLETRKKPDDRRNGGNGKKKKAPKFPRSRFGGEIVSAGAIPMAYPLDAKKSAVARWDAFSDESPADRTVVFAAKNEKPAVELALPQTAVVRGIVICNVDDPKLAPCQAPLIVSASEDGENWTELLREEVPEDGATPQAKEKWEIDLSKSRTPLRARYFRVERPPLEDARGERREKTPFGFSKMVVYGRKAR